MCGWRGTLEQGDPGDPALSAVIGISRGVLVEIIDDGPAGTPVVKGDLYAAEVGRGRTSRGRPGLTLSPRPGSLGRMGA